jgi:hypothetical protein
MNKKKVENERFFGEFEQTIKEKYGVMADDMLDFFDDFTMFFTEQKIPLRTFAKEHINMLMSEYLNYEGLTEAECSMAYQMLLDFADFSSKNNIDSAFFTHFLKTEKETIYEYWLNDSESEFDFQAFFDNFDLFYDMMRSEIKNMKPDFDSALHFIDHIYRLLDATRSLAVQTKKDNPNISGEELQNILVEHARKEAKHLSILECSEEAILTLPKPLAKRYIEIGCKILELNNHMKGSTGYLSSLENLLRFLEKLREDIKKLKTKKK